MNDDDDGRERWVKRKGRSGDVLALRTINEDDGEGPPCKAAKSLFALAGPSEGTPNNVFEGQADEHSIVGSGSFTVAGQAVPVEVQVVLRSTAGVIYYLGEYLRAGLNAPKVVTNSGLVPIINVTATRPDRVFVSTRHKGQRYYVPATAAGRIDESSGRSSQVFTLVEQLLNLHKSAKDRPTTQKVRVVQ